MTLVLAFPALPGILLLTARYLTNRLHRLRVSDKALRNPRVEPGGGRMLAMAEETAKAMPGARATHHNGRSSIVAVVVLWVIIGLGPRAIIKLVLIIATTIANRIATTAPFFLPKKFKPTYL